MYRYETLAIVGVGLIGASIGMAARQRGLARQVVGIGRRTNSLERAKSHGALDRFTMDLAEGVAEADFVVVATPVELIAPQVEQVAAACSEKCLITDAGSTKADLVAYLERTLPEASRFVGSHPLAGSEKTGPDHARADLYDDRLVVVTPGRKSREADVRDVSRFWRAIGVKKVIRMTPAEHDRALAATSHLPHMVASALALATPSQFIELVSSGWLDTTRIAAGDAELWRQIFAANRTPVIKAIERMEQRLAKLRESLEAENFAALKRSLTRAKEIRDAVGS